MIPPALRSALRSFARSPRPTLAAVLCIAVGTAATGAALTLVSATLLQPLPFPDAERLVRVWFQAPDGEERIALSYPDLQDLARSVDTLDAFEATARARMLLQEGEGARRVEGEAVTSGYFELLGVEPLVGRLFSPEEHRPGGEAVMLLDYRTWGERYGYDEGLLGTAIRTDAGEHVVVGVLPPSFTGSVEEDSGDIELWVPIEQYLSEERRGRRDVGGIWGLGRLAPGESLASAEAELAALGERLAGLHPEVHGGHGLTVERLGENWRSGLRRGSLLLLAAACVLLLVAATNVAVLLLARAIDRRRELAIRSALGADRGRMLGQTLVETLLLVGAGSALGLGLGPPLLRLFLEQPSLVDGSLLGIPVFVRLTIDPTAAALSLLVFLVTAVVASLGPAVIGFRVDPGRVLQEGGRSSLGSRRSRRWSSALVFTEVALTTVLVVGAALLARSYHAMETADLGFRTDDVLRIALFVNERDVPETEALAPFYERVRQELSAEPGVDEVGVVWPTVPIDWPIQESFTVPGRDLAPAPGGAGEAAAEAGRGVRAGVFAVDAAFFDVLDLPLLAGRPFRATDGPDSAPVALVSSSLAERIAGPGERPERAVGTEAALRGEPVRVVGVVGDARYGGPREEEGQRYEIYLPFAQSPQRLMSLTIATGGGDPRDLVPPLSRRLARIAPDSALDWVGPLDRWVSDLYLVDTRFLLSLVGAFSLAGLFLSAVGLFAVLADSVARRRGELGLRQALGATPRRILATVVAQGVRVVVLGLAAGAVLAWGATQVLESTVYGVATTDPWSYAAAAAVLLTAAVAASLLPARRASRVDPAEALREE